ncbi:hypothetical protein ACIGW8_16855 [Streptomyces sioyaensis]|uniref:hypothetical protein n=1 Tax=Streptomyces sioyaensis TaxID=67364 RepID=UPI0037D53379
MSVLVNDADTVLSAAFISRVSNLPDDHEAFRSLALRWLAYDKPEESARRAELALTVEEAQARMDSLDDAYYVQGRFKGAKGQNRYEQLRAAIEAQLEPMSAELAEIAASLDPEVLLDPDVLHKAWIAADLERARMLLRVVLHSVTLLPPPGPGKRSIWELYARCCFHWVGSKQEPLKVDNRRLHNTVWFDPEPAAWQSAA